MGAMTETETPQDQLSRDLYGHLVDLLRTVAPGQRRHWVMNLEWFSECRKIQRSGTILLAIPSPGREEHMLGIPLTVTEDGGFPHLVVTD